MINYIISPLLGGIIGYFTNWLAIKMLFLPYKAKYIGKFRIPFTPGLIPKERERLAKKIAFITEEKILNKETIEENLFSQENKEKIYLLLEKNFYKLKQKDFNFNDIIKILYGERKEIILKKVENIILFKINKFIFEEKNQKILVEILTEKIYDLLKNIDKNKEVKIKLENIIINIINNKNIKENIYNLKLCDIINNENISDIKMAIFESIPKLCEYISNRIINDEDIDKKLGDFIKNIIRENLGTIAGLFLNTDKVYETIKKNIILYLNNKENQNIIGIKIFETISLYQNKTIFEIYEKIPNKTKDIIKQKTSIDNLKTYVNKSKILENLYLIVDDNNLKESIKKFITKLIKEKISINIYKAIKNYIKINKNKILNININFILDKINISSFKDKIFNLIQKFIDKQGDKILSNISISSMIETKINSFDMETIQNIIVSVTKKELNAITIIGGILGFIIGLIPIIIK